MSGGAEEELSTGVEADGGDGFNFLKWMEMDFRHFKHLTTIFYIYCPHGSLNSRFRVIKQLQCAVIAAREEYLLPGMEGNAGDFLKVSF
jgi:hypothetical protein